MPILRILRVVFLRIVTKVLYNKRLPEFGELPSDLWGVELDEAEHD